MRWFILAGHDWSSKRIFLFIYFLLNAYFSIIHLHVCHTRSKGFVEYTKGWKRINSAFRERARLLSRHRKSRSVYIRARCVLHNSVGRMVVAKTVTRVWRRTLSPPADRINIYCLGSNLQRLLMRCSSNGCIERCALYERHDYYYLRSYRPCRP